MIVLRFSRNVLELGSVKSWNWASTIVTLETYLLKIFVLLLLVFWARFVCCVLSFGFWFMVRAGERRHYYVSRLLNALPRRT